MSNDATRERTAVQRLVDSIDMPGNEGADIVSDNQDAEPKPPDETQKLNLSLLALAEISHEICLCVCCHC